MTEIHTENLRTTKQIVEAHPHIVSLSALQTYAKRRRAELQEKRIMFRGQKRALLWDEQALLRWLIGM